MTNDYVPVACDFHSVLEDAIVRRLVLDIELTDGQTLRGVVAIDVYTRSPAEYLKVRLADGAEREIRLDHLARTTPR